LWNIRKPLIIVFGIKIACSPLFGKFLVPLCKRYTPPKSPDNSKNLYDTRVYDTHTIPVRVYNRGMSKLNRDDRGKPIPPRKDWPLTANGNGQWSKKFKGTVYYFGRWDDWRAAEEDFNRRWPLILAGIADPHTQQTTVTPSTATFDSLANLFLAGKLELASAGKIKRKHYEAIRRELAYLLAYTPRGETQAFEHRNPNSITPEQWAKFSLRLEDDYGVDTRKRMVANIRSLSRYAAENGYSLPFNFGGKLAFISKGEVRAARRQKERERGPMLFPAEQVRLIVQACDMPLDAMFLLSINCGMYAGDCAELPKQAIDLDAGIMDFDRVKSGVQRVAYLWPETVSALRHAIASRPAVNEVKLAQALDIWKKLKPEGREAVRQWELRKPDWRNLCFLTRFGVPWVRDSLTGEGDTTSHQDGIGLEFRKVLKLLDVKHKGGVGGLAFKRQGIAFKAGRHTFYTNARAIHEHAANYIMAHAREDMGEWYDHLDDGKRQLIRRVCYGVRSVLLGEPDPTSLGTTTLRLRLPGADAEAGGVLAS
jgi:hypothetical protein